MSYTECTKCRYNRKKSKVHDAGQWVTAAAHLTETPAVCWSWRLEEEEEEEERGDHQLHRDLSSSSFKKTVKVCVCAQSVWGELHLLSESSSSWAEAEIWCVILLPAQWLPVIANPLRVVRDPVDQSLRSDSHHSSLHHHAFIFRHV